MEHFLESIDLQALFWFQGIHQPWLDTLMKTLTYLGDRRVMAVVAALGAGMLVLAQQMRPAIFLVVCALLAGVLTEGIKRGVKRARPDVAYALEPGPPSGSFPSGHSLLSAAIYGTIALAAVSRLSRRRWQILVLAGAGLLILVVGFSRLYLGVHYVTDVVAAWLAGGGCAFLFLWLDRQFGSVPAAEPAPPRTLPPVNSPTPAEQVVSAEKKETFRS